MRAGLGRRCRRLWLAVVVLLPLTLAACGSNDGDERPAAAAPQAQAPAQAADSQQPTFAPVIVNDERGMTVYFHDNDVNGKSRCNGSCEQYWPPLRPPANFQPSGEFRVITRADGTSQVSYQNRPLYLFAGDKKPGDTRGDGVQGVWHVLRY